jgi:dynein light chain roadblock-type
MTEVEATLQRISSHKGVLGCIIVSSDGVILKTTCEPEVAELHAHLIPQLAGLARSLVRDLDPSNDLEFLRIRSFKHEIMVAPNPDYALIVIQDPKADVKQ